MDFSSLKLTVNGGDEEIHRRRENKKMTISRYETRLERPLS